MSLQMNEQNGDGAGLESGWPPPEAEERAGLKPVHEIRFRNIRATIWHNEGDRGLWYSVRISRSYRDADGNWHRADTFNSVELLIVAELTRAAFYWIAAGQTQRPGPSPDDEISF